MEKDIIAADVFNTGMVLGFPVFLSAFLAGGVWPAIQFTATVYLSFTIAALIVKFS